MGVQPVFWAGKGRGFCQKKKKDFKNLSSFLARVCLEHAIVARANEFSRNSSNFARFCFQMRTNAIDRSFDFDHGQHKVALKTDSPQVFDLQSNQPA